MLVSLDDPPTELVLEDASEVIVAVAVPASVVSVELVPDPMVELELPDVVELSDEEGREGPFWKDVCEGKAKNVEGRLLLTAPLKHHPLSQSSF